MKKLFIIMPVLLLLLVQEAYCQNDLTEFGYKGALYKVIHRRYRNPIKTSGEWVVNGEFVNEMTQVYNEQGNLDTFCTTTVISDSKKFVSKVVYDYANHNKTGWRVYDGGGTLIGKGFVNRMSKTAYKEKQYDNAGKLINETLNYLDKNLNLCQMNSKDHFSEDTSWTVTETTLIRPEAGPASMEIDKNLTENSTDTTRYYILHNDRMGNPVKTLAITNKDTILSVREYFYRD